MELCGYSVEREQRVTDCLKSQYNWLIKIDTSGDYVSGNYN